MANRLGQSRPGAGGGGSWYAGEGMHRRFLTLQGQILSRKPCGKPYRIARNRNMPEGHENSTIYSLRWLGCLRCSKSASIQMTRHQMIGGYLLQLWLNLGALPHGEGATRMEVAAGGRINR